MFTVNALASVAAFVIFCIMIPVFSTNPVWITWAFIMLAIFNVSSGYGIAYQLFRLYRAVLKSAYKFNPAIQMGKEQDFQQRQAQAQINQASSR